ncbi:hypothetical protein [Sulfuriflexus mobilis]|uniref:hypothetical protein n=1 Tax=Sulfuriflexus mobilis TaxID=1811807 RepID=UPI000F8330F7|nr:hypothetical protein [Sulfuriflexus mobilis]
MFQHFQFDEVDSFTDDNIRPAAWYVYVIISPFDALLVPSQHENISKIIRYFGEITEQSATIVSPANEKAQESTYNDVINHGGWSWHERRQINKTPCLLFSRKQLNDVDPKLDTDSYFFLSLRCHLASSNIDDWEGLSLLFKALTRKLKSNGNIQHALAEYHRHRLWLGIKRIFKVIGMPKLPTRK